MSEPVTPAYAALATTRTLCGWWADIGTALIGLGMSHQLPAGTPAERVRWLLRQYKGTRAQVADAILAFYPDMQAESVNAFRFLRDHNHVATENPQEGP